MSDESTLVIATLDTKGDLADFLAKRIAARGARPLIVDTGILGEVNVAKPDVTREEVAQAAGKTLDEVRHAGARGPAVAMMMDGLRALMARMLADPEQGIEAAIGIGGAEGGVLSGAALSSLPLGIPKLIVSPLATGTRTFDPFVGHSDIAVLNSVADLEGLNQYTTRILDQAAGMITGGTAPHGAHHEWPAPPAGLVAMSLNGNLAPGGTRLRKRLEGSGHEVVSFHANGVGGITMEEHAVEGEFDALVDLVANEVTDEIVDGIFDVQDRMRISRDVEIPRVILPGCLDFVAQGPVDSIEERFQGLPIDRHNPQFTCVRLDLDRTRAAARAFAERALDYSGPVHVVVPLRGLSHGGSPGGSFVDPDLDDALTGTIVDVIGDRLPLTTVDAPINDERVTDAIVAAFRDLPGT